MISIGGSDDDRAVGALQHAAGRLDAGDVGLDHIVFVLRRIADGDEILLGVDEDQAIARAVARRLCDQPAVFGEGLVDLVQRNVCRRRHAAERGEMLGRDLVEGEMRGGRARSGEGTPRASHITCNSPFSARPPCRPSTSTRSSALAWSSACPSGMPRCAGLELVLEGTGVFEQLLRLHDMHLVLDVPPPEIGLGQRLMQRLG